MRNSGTMALLFIVGVLAVRAVAAFASPCGGDCNVDAVTSVNELVTCVNIGLGVSEHAACTSCDQGNDGVVAIDDLVDAVGRAVGGCQTSFVEAASGVAELTADAASGYQVLDFGYLGSAAALRRGDERYDGSGEGFAACIECPGGGEVSSYDCASANGRSTMTVELDGCSDGANTRTGKLELEVADAAFCRSCRVLPGAAGAQTFSEYSQVGLDGKVIQIPDVLSEAFTTKDEGCLGPDRPDKTSRVDGIMRVIGPDTDVSFMLDSLTVELSSALITRNLCQAATRLSGGIQVEDAVNDRRFLQKESGLLITETTQPGGARETTIDTLRGGSLEVDCFGGEIQYTTLEGFFFPDGADCATAGRMQVAFPGARSLSEIRATKTGGLAFDFDSDGSVDSEVESCRESSLAQCRVELPQSRPPAEPVPTGKVVVASDERPLTDLAFTRAPDTDTFAANLAAWFTDGKPGRIHAYSRSFGVTQFFLSELMAERGHTFTTGTNLPFNLPTLMGFDAIYSALQAPGIDLDILSTYVRGGGNVYIAAGTSQDAVATADFWRPFLQRFGLALEDRIDIQMGIFSITSSHPIFDGVSDLYHDGGQGVLALDSRAEIIAYFDGIGLYGVYPASESMVGSRSSIVDR